MSAVLLLEDDMGLRFALEAGLQDAGHEVLAVADCNEAIHALKTFKPDVMVLDLMISGISSISVASFASYAAPKAQIVYVTGSGMFPKGELFDMSENVRWVLRKPVRMPELADMIDHVTHTHQPSEDRFAVAT